MSLIKDLITITRELKRYNYINEFFSVLAASADDAASDPTIFGKDYDKQETIEMINWFKESKNIAKAELETRQHNVDIIINDAMKTNLLKFYILRGYTLIYLDITLVRLWVLSLFFHRKFDDKMANRAYEYMLEHTDMSEEEEENEDYE